MTQPDGEVSRSMGGEEEIGRETETGHRLPVEKGDLPREQQAVSDYFWF